MDLYVVHKTLKVRSDDTIMELFNYFVNRDMILEASFMQSNSNEQEEENTLLQIEEQKEIELKTDLFPPVYLDLDIFSEAELFYKNHKGKDAYALEKKC